MRSLAEEAAGWGFERYDRAWRRVARAGLRSVALDTRAGGWRYVSLNTLLLTPAEGEALARLTPIFGRLAAWATDRLLHDPDWSGDLGWPGAALELARQEPVWGDLRQATAYGRFDWLLHARDGQWRLVEYNADTPSGGREVSGLEPAILRLHPGHSFHRPTRGLQARLTRALLGRIHAFERGTGRPVRLVGVVSSHGWLEDLSQAWWLALLLARAGAPTLVGDVNDVAVLADGRVLLRGHQIDALYRFYPIERLYRHGVFGPLWEAAIERRLLILNGLRGFLAQSKAALAYLWLHRAELPPAARAVVEAHLPPIMPARHADAAALLPDSVVKHVNGREGAEVSFGAELCSPEWDRRLLDGGWVVQRRVEQQPVSDVEVDEVAQTLEAAAPRYACVGAFCVDGRYAGLYTRVGGPITRARSAFVPTVVER